MVHLKRYFATKDFFANFAISQIALGRLLTRKYCRESENL